MLYATDNPYLQHSGAISRDLLEGACDARPADGDVGKAHEKHVAIGKIREQLDNERRVHQQANADA